MNSKTDAYLIHQLNAIKDGKKRENKKVAVLIQATEGWRPSKIRGLTIRSHLGNIRTGLATPEAVEALKKDPNVLRLEYDREDPTQQ